MSAGERMKRVTALAGVALGGIATYGWYSTRRFESLDLESVSAPGAFLDVDGERIHYVATGQGEPVVLIHGWNGSTFSFRYTIPELAQHYRVVAPDLRGFGYSPRPPHGDYSLAAQAALVGQVMDGLDIGRAAVVGHSMGGGVAMRLALREPERISRLVLVDSVTTTEHRYVSRYGWLLRPLVPLGAPFTLHRESFRRRALRTAVHDPAFVTPELLDGYFRPMRMKGHLRALTQQLIDRRNDELLDPERILQPTLILWGEHDRWLPPERGDELARRIPNSRLVAVPSAGHMPLEEQPDFCNRVLLDFLRRVADQAATLETLG